MSKIIFTILVLNCAFPLFAVRLIAAENGNNDTLVVAYTANLNANLQPCGCGDEDLGGLTRLAGAIDSLRKKYPNMLLVDAGDWLNSFPLTETDTLVSKIMGEMTYTAMNVGDQEFVEGGNFLSEMKKRYHLPLLSATFHAWDSSTLQSGVMMNKVGSFSVLIYAYCSLKTFSFLRPPGMKRGSSNAPFSDFPLQMAKRADLVLILAHQRYMELTNFPSVEGKKQIIITGHSQDRFVQKTEFGLIAEPGMDGEYLGMLKIFKNSSGNIEFRNQFLPMDDTVRESVRARKLVDEFYQKLSKQP